MKIQGSCRPTTVRTFGIACIAGIASVGMPTDWVSAIRAVDKSSVAEKPAVDPSKFPELIERLGNDDYFVREKAQAELAEAGTAAFDALSAAVDAHRDVETLDRIRYLLRLIKVEWTVGTDPPEVVQALLNYGSAEEETRAGKIRSVGRMTDLAATAALCRIVRYDANARLSKLAAVTIITQKPTAGEEADVREKAIKAGVGDSPRPGAAWLRTYLVSRTDADSAVKKFAEEIEAENHVFRQYPQKSSPEILMSLWRRQAELLKGLDRRREAVAAMMQMVALETGGGDALGEILQWLVENEAWGEVDELAARFGPKFAGEPLLAYALANARKLQGRNDEAAKIVAATLKLNEDQLTHLRTGRSLRDKGMVEWSEGEYRRAIEIGPAGQMWTLQGQYLLGESLHDRQIDDEAGKVLDDAARDMEAIIARMQEIPGGRSLSTVRARAHYFHALHFGRKGEGEKRKQHLLEGLGEDQYDAEILIELFRVPDLEPSVRDRVRKLIQESAANYRRQIAASPDDDTPYNQLAWLVSNTEGDFKEAIKASQKSIEIVQKMTDENPKQESLAGHLDTLGRCYYAAGEFEDAIKSQKKAIELDPHSQQMKRQLAEFEAAAKKKAP
jgi:tetratricopeptide (TPR) repeat protein